MRSDRKNNKGFTLIELLIVIAILAVLAVAVVLVINPQELLRRSRDATRLSDSTALRKAISLYLVSADAPDLSPNIARCYMTGSVATGASCGVFTGPYTTNASTSRSVDGTGWLPVNFTAIRSGAPFGTLPYDPVSDLNFFYAYYAGANDTYEINMRLESARYNAPPDYYASTDGGNNNLWLEVGSNLSY